MHGDTADEILEAIDDLQERIQDICGGSLPDMFRRADQDGEEAFYEEMFSPLEDIAYNLAVLREEGVIE